MTGGDPSDRYPVLDDLGRQMRAAAADQIARRGRAARRRRRTGGVAMVAVLGVAGAAGAAQLIGVGAPVDDRRDVAPVLRPADRGGRTVAATVADPDGGLPWAVATYAGTDGRACAVAGRSRAGLLGEVDRTGVFRPFPSDFAGSCGTLRATALTYNVARPRDTKVRTLVYGRAGKDVRRVDVVAEGRRTTAVPSRSGAFLLVFDGALAFGDVAVRAARTP